MRYLDIFKKNAVSGIPSRTYYSANGRYLILLPRPLFKVPIWHLESSSRVTSNMKSSPSNLSIFLLTALFNCAVSVPYISAKSKSSITRCPLISYILLWIISSWFMVLFYVSMAYRAQISIRVLCLRHLPKTQCHPRRSE